MLLVNLTGGPGSGKSTTAAGIFWECKLAGHRAELVGEEARELIYDGSIKMLENQILILGQQWQRIKRLSDSGANVAICDSPLSLSILYSKGKPYHNELTAIVRTLEQQHTNTFNILVKRVKTYDTFGRYQDEEQAKLLDLEAERLIYPLHLAVDGDRSGAIKAAQAVLSKLRP